MSREQKIFAICHLYPIYILGDMIFLTWTPICTAIFNIAPIFFVILLARIWIKTSHIRLSQLEEKSLYLFSYFFTVVHCYYAACALIMSTEIGKDLIKGYDRWFIAAIAVLIVIYTYLFKKHRATKGWD